jgi:hypothetical protein
VQDEKNKMITQTTPLQTILGYRDATDLLQKGIYQPQVKDVLRGVELARYKPCTRNNHGVNTPNFQFSLENFDGRVYQYDERVETPGRFDVIINKVVNHRPRNLLVSEIYHDFYEGERFTVKIFDIGVNKDPIFKLHSGIFGFVNETTDDPIYRYLKPGSIVAVEVIRLAISQHPERINPLVKALELIAEE